MKLETIFSHRYGEGNDDEVEVEEDETLFFDWHIWSFLMV